MSAQPPLKRARAVIDLVEDSQAWMFQETLADNCVLSEAVATESLPLSQPDAQPDSLPVGQPPVSEPVAVEMVPGALPDEQPPELNPSRNTAHDPH